MKEGLVLICTAVGAGMIVVMIGSLLHTIGASFFSFLWGKKPETVDLEFDQIVAKAIRDNGDQTESKHGWCNLYANPTLTRYSLGGVIFPTWEMAKQHTHGKVIVDGQEYRYLVTLPAPESFGFEKE